MFEQEIKQIFPNGSVVTCIKQSPDLDLSGEEGLVYCVEGRDYRVGFMVWAGQWMIATVDSEFGIELHAAKDFILKEENDIKRRNQER